MIRTTPEMREQLRADREWGTDTELLAQLLEEVSVLAADHRRKKPREVPRPAHLARKPKRGDHATARASSAHPHSPVAPAVAAIRGAGRRVYTSPAAAG